MRCWRQSCKQCPALLCFEGHEKEGKCGHAAGLECLPRITHACVPVCVFGGMYWTQGIKSLFAVVLLTAVCAWHALVCVCVCVCTEVLNGNAVRDCLMLGAFIYFFCVCVCMYSIPECEWNKGLSYARSVYPLLLCVCVFGVWGGEKIEKKTRMSPILLKCTYLDDAFNLVFLLKCNNL